MIDCNEEITVEIAALGDELVLKHRDVSEILFAYQKEVGQTLLDETFNMPDFD